MPTSYQAPMRKDQDKQSSHSQSESSNMQSQMATVADILKTKGGDIFTISPDDTLHQAVELLRDKRIGAVVAMNADGTLCGLLSERDIVRKLAETPGQTLPQQVRGVMTEKVITCSPEDALLTVLKRMNEGRFRHMPVVEGDKLVGMVTIGDVVNHRLTEVEHEALQLKQLIVG